MVDLTTRSTGPLAGGAYAPSARGRLAWFVRPHTRNEALSHGPKDVRRKSRCRPHSCACLDTFARAEGSENWLGRRLVHPFCGKRPLRGFPSRDKRSRSRLVGWKEPHPRKQRDLAPNSFDRSLTFWSPRGTRFSARSL